MIKLNTKKFVWGIIGILFAIGVTYYGFKSLNNGMMTLAIVFFIGALIGLVLGIKELVISFK